MTTGASQDPSQGFRLGVVQMRSSGRATDTLKQADGLIREAASAGADYILTPENTAFFQLNPELARIEAQPFDDNAALAQLRALARELGVWLHIGSLAVRPSKSEAGADDDRDDERLANRSCLISPAGEITAWYDKIHLFDAAPGGGESYKESNSYRPGQRAVLADAPFVRVGFSICYDLRFPCLYRTLARAGAQMLAVPSAFTERTGRAHWRVLLRARAIENGCFVAAAAQGGKHDIGVRTYGHSMVVNPWGEIIAEADHKQPGVIIADIDPAEVAKARARIPALQHDRPFELITPAIDATNARLEDRQ